MVSIIPVVPVIIIVVTEFIDVIEAIVVMIFVIPVVSPVCREFPAVSIGQQTITVGPFHVRRHDTRVPTPRFIVAEVSV